MFFSNIIDSSLQKRGAKTVAIKGASSTARQNVWLCANMDVLGCVPSLIL
jgi:hypothetical protein